jgi:hypothetical protein
MSLRRRHPRASGGPGGARAAVSLLLLLLALLFAVPAAAQPLLPPSPAPVRSGDELEISVLTFGPGEIYWERFGHNAILVRDHATGSAVAFNYGMFDFRQKNFFLNFARGYMLYRIGADPLERDLDIYQYEGRWVQEQKLNLSPAQRLALYDYLLWNVRPEHRDYQYDYFLSNCSTKVRDALDQVLGGSLHKQLEAKMTSNSYRFDAVRLVSPDFWAGIGMDVALGPVADLPQSQLQESFVPMVLMQQLREARVVDADGREQPLVREESRILQARIPDDPPRPPDWRLPFLLAGLGLAALLLVLDRLRGRGAARWSFAVLASAYTLLCGVCGVILLVLWGCTQHWAGWHNENLLLLDPLCLLLLPTWLLSGRAHWQPRPWARQLIHIVAALAAFSLVLRLVPGCWQANLPWILLLLPPHLALLHSARRAVA